MIAAGKTVTSPKARYLVQSERGRGGFGVAWRATRQADGFAVVLKELRLDRLEDWKAMQLFEREARVMSQLSHPNIPSYVEFFGLDAEGRPFDIFTSEPRESFTTVLVQQFIPGQNLEERRRDRKRYTPTELEEMLTSMLEVLSYLHHLSPPVIHRDISPKNVVRSESGDFFLVDFGAIQDRLRSGTMLGSTNVGTFGFIPPEQAMGHTKPTSDLFALAMTVVVAGTGRTPDELPLDEETGKLSREAFSPSWSKRLISTLDRMLEPIVGKRIQTAEEALRGLRTPASSALVLSSDGRHRASVTVGRTVQIGRAENVDIRVADPSVSRYHASVAHRSDGRFMVRDLGSARGTWVDGQKTSETALYDGAHLRLGAANYLVHFDSDDVILVDQGREEDALELYRSGALLRPTPRPSYDMPVLIAAILIVLGTLGFLLLFV
jgi:serine/threonine protein kinase